MTKLTGLTVFKNFIPSFSMFLWVSPNLVKASLALGWGSLTPIPAKTSPKSRKIYIYVT